IYYLYVPYRNQNDLPLFDTQPMTFDFWQLFTTNRFSGADRQMNANDLSLALTTRLLDSDGVERVSASIGQIRYFDPQKVTLFPGGKAVDYSGSNYVANLTVSLNDNCRLTSSQQWNPNTDETDVSTLGLQRRLWGDGIVNFDYRYRRGLLEQADMSAEVPVGAAWKLVGGYTYSLRDKQAIDTFAGIEWDSCCAATTCTTTRATPTTPSCSKSSSRGLVPTASAPARSCAMLFLAINDCAIVHDRCTWIASDTNRGSPSHGLHHGHPWPVFPQQLLRPTAYAVTQLFPCRAVQASGRAGIRFAIRIRSHITNMKPLHLASLG